MFKLSCLNELCQALFPSREASSASFRDSLHCTGRFAFEKKRGRGRRGPLLWLDTFLCKKHQGAPLRGLNYMSLAVLTPPSKLFTPGHADFEIGLGFICKAWSPRSTHLPQSIKLPLLYSRKHTGSYFWPQSSSYSV